eukprot:scaffold267117_cov26-Tisochrysis_lutea.AAC.2
MISQPTVVLEEAPDDDICSFAFKTRCERALRGGIQVRPALLPLVPQRTGGLIVHTPWARVALPLLNWQPESFVGAAVGDVDEADGRAVRLPHLKCLRDDRVHTIP